MKIKSSIFTQIWLPYTIIVLVLIGVLAMYYPSRQRALLGEYKMAELRQQASTLALSVELSLERDDYLGLTKTMNHLQADAELKAVSIATIESNKSVSYVTIPDTVDHEKMELDTVRYLTIKYPFSHPSMKGYVALTISKEDLKKDVSAMNRPIFLFLTLIAAVILVIVYFLANLITDPIKLVKENAIALQQGSFELKMVRNNYQAKELNSLQDSLFSLSQTLKEQKATNDQLTAGLEEEVKLRTNNLFKALEDLNVAQTISKLGSFEYNLENDTWQGSDNLKSVLGIHDGFINDYDHFMAIVFQEDAEEVEQTFQAGFQSKGRFELNFRLRRPIDQVVIWVKCIGEFVQDAKTNDFKLAGVLQDITEQVKAQEELNILSLVAKKTSNAVIITDRNRKIQWVNDSALRITGYTMEEVIGRSPKMFQFEKTDKKEIERINIALAQGKSVWAELLNVGKGGNEYWLSINIVPLFNAKNDVTGYMAVENDITERKEMEFQREQYVKLLEDSRAEIRTINEGLEKAVEEKTKHIANLALFPEQNPNPVLEFDLLKAKLNYVNPAAKRILGELLNLPFIELLLTFNITSHDLQSEHEKGEFHYEGLIFEINLFMLEEKKILRAYLHNITERKQNEEKLSHLVSQLTHAEHELREKTEALERSLDELKLAQSEIVSKERLSTLGMLIAGIAHEINTPLGAIKASGENLKYLFTDGVMKLISQMEPSELMLAIKLYERAQIINLSTAEERQYIQKVVAQMHDLNLADRLKNKMARMLVQKGIFSIDNEIKQWMKLEKAEQIFQLSLNFVLILRSINTTTASSDQGSKVVKALNSFAHGNLSSEKSHFNLKENVDTVLTIMWNKIKQGSRVVNAIPDDIVCFGLAEEMSQVWTNLVNNALQASGNNCMIAFEYLEKENNHTIIVANDGPMIPAEIVGKIFEPFFTTKARGEGTGLGLNIVRKIMEKQGGSIVCESDERLTRFIVTLPKINTE
jgi:PAS domain S-box-containing protein